MPEGFMRGIEALNGIVWGPMGLGLLFGTGLLLTVRTGGFQLRRWGYWMRHTLGAILTDRSVTAHTAREEQAISQFQSLCTALASTIGTGNLFARNMGVPVDDIDAALTVATSHGSRLVDMGRLTLLDHPEDDHGHAFLIIAGIGFDAAMIDDTNPELKANISWLAYFVGGVKNLFAPKFRGTLTVTSADGSTHTIKNLDFRTVMAGNCGQIPMFSLMPAASYDDGLLDFEIIDTTGGILGWANLFGDVVHQTIIGKPEQNPLSTNSTIEQVQGVSAEITLEKPAKAQVDGDMLPETKHIRFSVDHRALIVRVPDASALEKTAQAAASNATSDFAEMTGTLEPIR